MFKLKQGVIEKLYHYVTLCHFFSKALPQRILFKKSDKLQFKSVYKKKL